ncbi:XRE family transcriptional regulator [Longispora fulva]|uniref:DNA-binding SARP family transcriptional activator/Tfp pilus assembly protein PilF n=1 Tax=Longispora fulva TaxID=619741 RepID=A0A8J7KGN2_9ACTN|nr:tetratricopeptide repeat protein [Longispora fulva]MBG6137565.1 DNA-binding SARP family transcriptional activator/Tfp pilus assembly protein PilF [Longispora fulva]GIG61081.1 XRE family transcriptional regulator [Longispora fulva]
MRLGLLGPVEYWHDDQPLPLGPPMQRAVLAVLALDTGRVVSVERLVEALWGEDPPPRPQGMIQTYISRLRALFRPVGVGITRRGGGYALDVPPTEVDAHVFRQRVAVARAAGDRVGLRAALDLWRGEPLSDVPDSELVDRARAGLVEERLTALEICLDLELDAGLHREALAELSTLAGAHPLREEPLRLLMLALYRGGRQAEALERYDEARRLLADELGLEPSAALAALQGQILRGEGTPPAAPAPVEARSVPRLLPYDVPDFTGRSAEVARLGALAARSATTVVISAIDGMAGVGKTATAVHVAHSLAGRFPDGQLFIDLHGFTAGRTPVAPGAALASLLRALGVPDAQIPTELDERAALWRDELADRRVLVVLDNAANAAQVRPLIPGTKGSLVLITSRRRLATVDGAVPVSLDVLSEEDAHALFVGIVGDRARAEPGATAEVLGLCGCLPLALRIAAARLAHRDRWTVAHLAERLRAERHRLAEFAVDDQDVSAVFQLSYADLVPEQQRLFRLLGTHPGPDVDVYAAAALAGVQHRVAEDLLDGLVDAHLLTQRTAGRYTMHDLLRFYAADLAGTAERHDALTRLFDHYRYTASRAMDVYDTQDAHRRPPVPPSGSPTPELADGAAAVVWLDAERANLMAVAGHAAAHGWLEHTADLSLLLTRYLDTGSHYLEAETLHRLALGGTDQAKRGKSLSFLGITCWRRGRYAEAYEHFRLSMIIAGEVGDRSSEGNVLNNMGVVLVRLGRYDEAIAHHERAMVIAREVGEPVAEARNLSNIAIVHKRLGRYPEALREQRAALEIFRRVGSRTAEGITLQNLANLCRILKRYPEALIHYGRSLEIALEYGDRGGEANALDGVGMVHLEQGRLDQALDHFTRGLELAREVGERYQEMNLLNGLGETLSASGEHRRALLRFDAAHAIASELGERAEQARAHRGLGHAHRALGETEDARLNLKEALALYTELGVPEVQAVREALRDL